MFSIAYVNGKYLPYSKALTHVEDRGYQFADGVYEVALLEQGCLIDFEPHMQRLERSLRELQISGAPAPHVLRVIIREIIERSKRSDGLLYIQITRGIASRDHPFPRCVRPSIIVCLMRAKPPKREEIEKGAKIITVPENRWARRDIKSISLLPNVLAKQLAVEAGAREAVFVGADGVMTEGSSTNLYIVKNGVIITHPVNENILSGVTRDTTLRLARSAQMEVLERPFTRHELMTADECFITSTSAGVLPITRCDNQVIATASPGSITRRLMERYDNNKQRQIYRYRLKIPSFSYHSGGISFIC